MGAAHKERRCTETGDAAVCTGAAAFARPDKKNPLDPKQLTPREFWLRIARQGGYIGRTHDDRPGWSTIWKGWYDFIFMLQGAEFMGAAQGHPKRG